MSEFFDEQFPQIRIPYLLDYDLTPYPQNRKLIQGPIIKSGSTGKWKSSFFEYINKKYDYQLIRVVLSWRESACYNVFHLGKGFKLLCSGKDPGRNLVTQEGAFYLAFLFNNYAGNMGGIYKLRRFLDYASTMPDCPFEVAYLRPTGNDLLKSYGSHLLPLGYSQEPKATTRRLERAYGRVLQARPTKAIDEFGKPYWRADSFRPSRPEISRNRRSWAKLFENA